MAIGSFLSTPTLDYLAVFDGHAGSEVSAFCSESLHTYLEPQTPLKEYPAMLERAYAKTHKGCAARSGGSCALTLLITVCLHSPLLPSHHLSLTLSGAPTWVILALSSSQLLGVRGCHVTTSRLTLMRRLGLKGQVVGWNGMQRENSGGFNLALSPSPGPWGTGGPLV